MAEGDAMEFMGKTLKWVDCEGQFVVRVGEQVLFSENHFQREPGRCKRYKAMARSERAPVETRNYLCEVRRLYNSPIQAATGRPVLCRSCLDQKRQIENRAANCT
jgi:hypothetical protein